MEWMVSLRRTWHRASCRQHTPVREGEMSMRRRWPVSGVDARRGGDERISLRSEIDLLLLDCLLYFSRFDIARPAGAAIQLQLLSLLGRKRASTLTYYKRRWLIHQWRRGWWRGIVWRWPGWRVYQRHRSRWYEFTNIFKYFILFCPENEVLSYCILRWSVNQN